MKTTPCVIQVVLVYRILGVLPSLGDAEVESKVESGIRLKSPQSIKDRFWCARILRIVLLKKRIWLELGGEYIGDGIRCGV